MIAHRSVAVALRCDRCGMETRYVYDRYVDGRVVPGYRWEPVSPKGWWVGPAVDFDRGRSMQVRCADCRERQRDMIEQQRATAVELSDAPHDQHVIDMAPDGAAFTCSCGVSGASRDSDAMAWDHLREVGSAANDTAATIRCPDHEVAFTNREWCCSCGAGVCSDSKLFDPKAGAMAHLRASSPGRAWRHSAP